jgi:hypothetical protein
MSPPKGRAEIDQNALQSATLSFEDTERCGGGSFIIYFYKKRLHYRGRALADSHLTTINLRRVRVQFECEPQPEEVRALKKTHIGPKNVRIQRY